MRCRRGRVRYRACAAAVATREGAASRLIGARVHATQWRLAAATGTSAWGQKMRPPLAGCLCGAGVVSAGAWEPLRAHERC